MIKILKNIYGSKDQFEEVRSKTKSIEINEWSKDQIESLIKFLGLFNFSTSPFYNQELFYHEGKYHKNIYLPEGQIGLGRVKILLKWNYDKTTNPDGLKYDGSEEYFTDYKLEILSLNDHSKPDLFNKISSMYSYLNKNDKLTKYHIN